MTTLTKTEKSESQTRSEGEVNIYNFVAKFKCVAEACIDNCCRGWQMNLDDFTKNLYKSSGNSELLDSYTEQGKYCVMKKDEKTGYCAKFKDGICSIHKNFGEEFLSDTCNFYPRIVREIGDEIYVLAHLSCPEITKFAILEKDSFTVLRKNYTRLPFNLKNYEDEGLSTEICRKIVVDFMVFATNDKKPEDKIRCMIGIAKNLMYLPKNMWHEAISNFIHTDAIISAPQKNEHDYLNILNLLIIIMKFLNKAKDKKLLELVSIYENAFSVNMDLEECAVVFKGDNILLDNMKSKIRDEDKEKIAGSLNNYFVVQILNDLYPFAGIGENPYDKIIVIAIKFTLIKLGLYALSILGKLDDEHIIKLIYRTSRLLDHLENAKLFMLVCKEYGWNLEARLNLLMEI